MSAKNQFDWISFYEEFADKLLAYKDNRQELIEKIKQVYEVTGIKLLIEIKAEIISLLILILLQFLDYLINN